MLENRFKGHGMTTEDVIETFSYTQEEQETFRYVSAYMDAVTPHLGRVLERPEGRRRFALAGLFLTYRMCVHTSQRMTTDTSGMCAPDVHLKRLEAFKLLTGEEIADTLQYLRMIRFGVFRHMLFRRDKHLYRFVLDKR